MEDILSSFFYKCSMPINKKYFKKKLVGGKFNREFYVDKVLEIMPNLNKKEAFDFIFKYNYGYELVNHFIRNENLQLTNNQTLNEFYGLFKLNILDNYEIDLSLDVKLKNIIFKPNLNTIQLDFVFDNPNIIYNISDCAYIDTLKKLMQIYYEELNLPHYSIFPSFAETRKILKSYGHYTYSAGVILNQFDQDEFCKIFNKIEINIITPTKTFNISYKMAIKIEWGNCNTLSNFNCMNFTSLSKEELLELKESYDNFNNEQLTKLFNEKIDEFKLLKESI